MPLLQMGRVPPDEVPYWINAANAVLVPSQAEGFGLSVIEAIACGVPAFGTPVGIHPVALHGIEGAYCAPYDRDAVARRAAPRRSPPRTRAWRAGAAPSCSRPTGWPRAWSRPGAACWRSAANARRPILELRGVSSDAPRRP